MGAALLIGGNRAFGEPPFAGEFLRPGLAGSCGELAQFRSVVYIKRHSWKREHDAGFAGGTCSLVMRFEAVIAEAQRKEISGPAQDGVSTAPIGGGDQHRA